MKKLFLIAMIAVIPALAFADFQIGVVALYNGDTSSTTTTTTTRKISASDFTYGLETRLNLWILQGAVSALYIPGDTATASYDTLRVMTDVGVCLDLWILRLGAGVGPNFSKVVDKAAPSSATIPFGFNAKLAADLMLGNLAAGVVGYYYLDSLGDLKQKDFFKTAKPMVGVTLLFKLF